MAGRSSSYADRRRAVARRLSMTQDLTTRLDEVVGDPGAATAGTGAPLPAGSPIDPDGVLRASVRALFPLAYRTPGFDVTVSLGPHQQWAVRVQHGPDGLLADLVPAGHRPPGPHQVTASETEIAAELAAWLWTGEVSR